MGRSAPGRDAPVHQGAKNPNEINKRVLLKLRPFEALLAAAPQPAAHGPQPQGAGNSSPTAMTRSASAHYQYKGGGGGLRPDRLRGGVGPSPTPMQGLRPSWSGASIQREREPDCYDTVCKPQPPPAPAPQPVLCDLQQNCRFFNRFAFVVPEGVPRAPDSSSGTKISLGRSHFQSK